MSNPEQRRNAPRRRIVTSQGSRMHPGWACFLLAWGSGLMTAFALVAAVQWAVSRLSIGYVIVTGGVAMALFIMGGKIAERLWDRTRS